jgi:VanZ like family/Concanavalin A-like lectin/glucanases superfamily
MWIEGSTGIHFGSHGTALSSEELTVGDADGACTIELWIQPAEIWAKGSIAAFYDRRTAHEFSIQQDLADLLLTNGNTQEGPSEKRQKLRVENVFRNKKPFITITSNGRQTLVYVDGRLAASSSAFPLSSRDLDGQIILGTSPLRNRSWSGDLRGLAVYSSAFGVAGVQQQYSTWVNYGLPQPGENASAAAAYTFTEHGGSTIASMFGPGPQLSIPDRFVVVDQLRFESPVSEFFSQDSYLKNAFINVIGFVPLGLVCSLYFRVVRRTKYVVAKTILTGATVSLAIEYVQSFLPTRFSGVTDLITNTMGTWLGILLWGFLLKLSPPYRVGRSIVQPSKETS